MLFFKLAVIAAAILIAWQAYAIWRLAKQLKAKRHAGERTYDLQKKKVYAAGRLGIFSIVAIGFIEEWVKLNPKPFANVNPWLLVAHVGIAFAYLLLIAAMICFTGEKYPGAHRIMGFSIFALLGALYITGGYMLWPLSD